jgi:hypothetical protein
MPVIISAVLVIILLVALIAILSQCGGNKRATTTTPASTTPTETYSILVTPSPSPTPTAAVPAEPVYLDQFASADITKSHTDWTTYYLGQWSATSHTGNFSVYNGGTGDNASGVLYTHGLGWFIKKSEFAGDTDKRALTFATKGLYDTLTFDMGVDKEWGFDTAKDCGSYQILVFVDDEADPVYKSDMVNYSYYKTGITVDVKGAQKVKIRLVEKKGTKGSLNVVLGNACFTPSAGTATNETTTAAETTTTAAQTTTAAATTTTKAAN